MVSVAGSTNGSDADQHAADAAVALELAAEAGQLLVAVRTENAGIDQGELKALGDRSSQDLLARRLAELRPGDAVLSEEAVDDKARLSADRVWIVDPLDGTREFSEGRHDWAVHVALWAGGDLVAGAVALAAGLHASRIDGSPLRYNQPDVLLPDLLVCRPELADLVLATIAQVQDETDRSEDAL